MTMWCQGKPLKVVNSAELLSKWVGDTPKNIDAVFEEAKLFDTVLMFDEAEGTPSPSLPSCPCCRSIPFYPHYHPHSDVNASHHSVSLLLPPL